MCCAANVYHNIIRNAFNMTEAEVTQSTTSQLWLVDIRILPIPTNAEREVTLKAASIHTTWNYLKGDSHRSSFFLSSIEYVSYSHRSVLGNGVHDGPLQRD